MHHLTLYDVIQRFVGMKEVNGIVDNPMIMAMLKLGSGEEADFSAWPEHDEVPWCSALMNWCAWFLRLPRSKSLRARSWLLVGRPVELHEARVGYDVVVLQRGTGKQPGPDVIEAPGHVTAYGGVDRAGKVMGLGGNQGNTVGVARYNPNKILGIRRLYEPPIG